MHDKTQCRRNECEAHAVSALGIAFYPTDALMNYYKNYSPASRMAMALELCEEHCIEAEGCSASDFIPEENLRKIAASSEKVHGITIDFSKTKIVRISLTDPDYLKLIGISKEIAGL